MAKAKKGVVNAVVKASKRTEKKPSKAKKLAAEASAVGAKTRKRRKQESEGDDLPPDEAEIESQTLYTDKLVAEVERQEDAHAGEGLNVDDDLSVETVLPSMEGMSILRETELNDVINDVKRRSEANGGYITYEELNQILPSNIVDAIQSDRYLKILEALGVQVLREEDVKKWVEAKNATTADPKAQKAEMIEDPIRMYLHQMGQVQLLKREEGGEICSIIEEAESKVKDMF